WRPSSATTSSTCAGRGRCPARWWGCGTRSPTRRARPTAGAWPWPPAGAGPATERWPRIRPSGCPPRSTRGCGRRPAARTYAAPVLAHLRRGEQRPRVPPGYRRLTFAARNDAPPRGELELALPRTPAARCLLAVGELRLHDRRSASIEIQVRFSPALDMALAP